jgi:hypothetical protein
VRACHVFTVLLVLLACSSTAASASLAVRLHAGFAPEHLGQAAAVSLDVEVRAGEAIPPPLAEVSVRYPAGLEIALSGVGIETCPARLLEFSGPQACPADSVMGTGRALTAMQIGPQLLRESANITVLRAPERDGHLTMLFYAAGNRPLIARALLVGELLPAAPPFGGRIRITVPPITTLPGQEVAIERLHIVLAPPGLTYYERIRGRALAYHPESIPLPSTCPHGGFPFSAAVVFLNGGETRTEARVPCPSDDDGSHTAPPRTGQG